MNKFKKVYGKVLIVDLSYFIHRALHVDSIFKLRGPDGQRSGAVFQVLRMISKEMRLNPGYFPILCSDAGLAPRRVKADPTYKHADERNTQMEVLTEEESDSDYLTQYRTQRNMIIEIMMYTGIPTLRFSQWEGDDLMYILTKISNNSRILTDDRDLLQLVSDNTDVRRPMADEIITKKSLLEENSYDNVYEFVMNKAIIGDGSDNIPGCCKGIGGGTSINLIKLINILKDEYDKDLSFINIENEEEIKNICKENNIKFRKAMLNFNLERYNINLELVDLNKVEVPDNIMESIYLTIDSCRQHVNYFSFAKMLNQMGIKEISPDEMINMVHDRYELLK